jgi:hypothetical protein
MADRRPQEFNRATSKGPQIRNALAKAARLLASESHVVLKTRNENFKGKVMIVNINQCNYGIINYIDTKAKCRHLNKLTCKGTRVQVFICSRLPPLLGFCLGWSSNFVGFEPGQIQSIKLVQTWSPTRLNTPYHLSAHTARIYSTLTQERGGRVEKVRGATVHKADCISTSLQYKV